MTNKSQAAYTHVFRFIEQKVFSLNCVSFTTDYELAMRNAIREVYPNSNLIACWFHFTQAVKKNASKISGFLPFIRNNELAEKIYYKLQCIPLLPPQYIHASFNKLKAEAFDINEIEFKKFFKYYQNQWIEKVTGIDLNIIFVNIINIIAIAGGSRKNFSIFN